VDTLLYPKLEDPSVERAIHLETGDPKSKMTGRPTGAYVEILYQGMIQTLGFEFNPGESQD